MKKTSCLLAVLAAMLLGGCGPEKRQYDIIVTNDMPQYITLWLTKDVGPWEDQWVPPEQAAYGNTREVGVGGKAIPPGVTVRKVATGYNTGPDNPAILRVYKASRLNQILCDFAWLAGSVGLPAAARQERSGCFPG